jgi:hypothetical protein
MPRIWVCNDVKIVRLGLSEVRRAIDIESHPLNDRRTGWLNLLVPEVIGTV